MSAVTQLQGEGQNLNEHQIDEQEIIDSDEGHSDVNKHHSLSAVPEFDGTTGAMYSDGKWNGLENETYSTENLVEADDHSAEEIEITDNSLSYSSNRVQYQYSTKSKGSIQIPIKRSYLNFPIKTDQNHNQEYVLPSHQRPPIVRSRPNGDLLQHQNYVTYTIKRDHYTTMNHKKPSPELEYWTIPRNPKNHYKLFDPQNPSITSQSLLERSSLRLRRKTPKKSRKRAEENSYREIQMVDKKRNSLESLKSYENHRLSSNLTDDLDDLYGNRQDADKRRSELKVYFRFSRGTLSDPYTLDFHKNSELLIHFQATCRGWLARQRFTKLQDENDAVCCIQRNANAMLNPWIRLMFALRPLIRTHRTEEELLLLRSEIERYKSLVRMLRFENAEYQAKVANLLQLLEQINTGGANTSSVNILVQQISDALSRNQDFWEEMATKNKELTGSIQQRSGDTNDPDHPQNYVQHNYPQMINAESSPMTRLKRDAEFYRDQVEMLREEADEQQFRSNEHYRSQVSVLSERVEQLQHMLALESSKVERLQAELEDRNTVANEAKAYERNLEHMVNQLSKQLEQRSKVVEAGVNETTNRDQPSLKVDEVIQQQIVKNQQSTPIMYETLVTNWYEYLASHPELAAQLENTPLKELGSLQFINKPTVVNGVTPTKVTESKPDHLFFPLSPSPVGEETPELTPRSNAMHEMVVLRRQLTSLQKQLVDSEERMKSETENREEIENENLSLRDRAITLDRQLRHAQDELDEFIKKEVSQQRALKDMQEQLDEETRKADRLAQLNRELEHQLTELRDYAEPEEDLMTQEWESMKSKLRADAMYYKRNLDQLREEYEQYRMENDCTAIQRQITEKEEKIAILEREQQQWRMELDIQQVKLQNATSLLEDTETRLKILNRERTSQAHRITQLETERDEAIREAAKITGRASADREVAAAKGRELEEMRAERDILRRELTEVKQALAGSTAENSAERRQLQERLREIEVHHEARISDLKSELERMREEVERLQADLQSTQASEMEMRSTNQHQKWRIGELEDQIGHYTRRIAALERRSTDLDAELVKAKADLSATRETAYLRRASKTRMADEWVHSMNLSNPLMDSDDEDKNTLSLGRHTKLDEHSEAISDDSYVPVRDVRNRSSLYQSSPNLPNPRYKHEFRTSTPVEQYDSYRRSDLLKKIYRPPLPQSAVLANEAWSSLKSPRKLSSPKSMADSCDMEKDHPELSSNKLKMLHTEKSEDS